MRDYMAAIGTFSALWFLATVIIPELAEARAARLNAWAAAARVTLKAIRLGWKQHWSIYRRQKEIETR